MFRDYNTAQDSVKELYKQQHTRQTLSYVKSMHRKYARLSRKRMCIWDALVALDSFVDKSDPDTELPQIQHALQTAEAARALYPNHGWLHLTALIHDMGKYLGVLYSEPQWAVVGDTFPVGCPFSSKCVYSDTFDKNPDMKDRIIQSDECGIYNRYCGLHNVYMSWGHDEYMYRVCVQCRSRLPVEALYMIRYHSFYPWHRDREYMYLCNEMDMKMLPWVKRFNALDLYSKTDKPLNVTHLSTYYKALIETYFPNPVFW